MLHSMLEWLLDFSGVHNGENLFATRMYNFWSGFGGNISVLALGGTVFGVYRHHLSRLAALNPLHRHHHGGSGDGADDADEGVSA